MVLAMPKRFVAEEFLLSGRIVHAVASRYRH